MGHFFYGRKFNLSLKGLAAISKDKCGTKALRIEFKDIEDPEEAWSAIPNMILVVEVE